MSPSEQNGGQKRGTIKKEVKKADRNEPRYHKMRPEIWHVANTYCSGLPGQKPATCAHARVCGYTHMHACAYTTPTCGVTQPGGLLLQPGKSTPTGTGSTVLLPRRCCLTADMAFPQGNDENSS